MGSSGARSLAESVARLNLPRRTFIVLVNATSKGVWLRGRDSMCSTFVCWGSAYVSLCYCEFLPVRGIDLRLLLRYPQGNCVGHKLVTKSATNYHN